MPKPNSSEVAAGVRPMFIDSVEDIIDYVERYLQ